eukprot:TRINITY_DN8802_c0_g1_i1.p1 TRINITY_DN8802_c0_g1~~TRINITY_DN8802_c0_g1_i1.p1  ORF type:complete len:378 (+),score=51.73 TRINITY_DN8802_c0_g1_i1:2264-3397(+)
MGGCESCLRMGIESEFEAALDKIRKKRLRAVIPDGIDSQQNATCEAEAFCMIAQPPIQARDDSREVLRSLKEAGTPEQQRSSAIARYTEERPILDNHWKILLKAHNDCQYSSVPAMKQPICHWLTHHSVVEAPAHTILYLHGGGMVWGNFKSQGVLGLAPKISQALQGRILYPDYRLLPEHSVTDAINDCMAAYNFLCTQVRRSKEIVIVGESSGAFLALWLLIRIRDLQLPRPGCVVAISAQTDLTLEGESHSANVQDLVTNEELAIRSYMMTNYGQIDPKDLSPIYQNLERLPAPVLLQVGGKEVCLSDSLDFYATAKAAGSDVTVEVWRKMYHGFQLFGDWHPEGGEALKQIANWVEAKLRSLPQEPTLVIEAV